MNNTFKYGSTAFFAAVLYYLVPQLEHDEGLRTKAYQDTAGVWTICSGETQGVYKGMEVTEEFCRKLTPERAKVFMMGVYSNLQTPLSVDTFRAHTGFAYNIGLGAYKTSSTLRLTNQGKVQEGCRAMLKFVCVSTAKGKGDATGQCANKERSKKFDKGLHNRRVREMNLCLEGS